MHSLLKDTSYYLSVDQFVVLCVIYFVVGVHHGRDDSKAFGRECAMKYPIRTSCEIGRYVTSEVLIEVTSAAILANSLVERCSL